ncbi:MAG: hypothetical protein ACXW0H_06955 [Methylobacter sp.]
MCLECVHVVIVEALGRVGLDLFDHSLDHAVRPRVLDLGINPQSYRDRFGLSDPYSIMAA